MDSFLVPVRRNSSFNRLDLLSEVARTLTARGRSIICGEGGSGYAAIFFCCERSALVFLGIMMVISDGSNSKIARHS